MTIIVEPFRRSHKTLVKGLDYKRVAVCETDKDLLKIWKKKLSCNGHIDDDGSYVFQGDHSRVVYDWIIKLGYSPDQILAVGTSI